MAIDPKALGVFPKGLRKLSGFAILNKYSTMGTNGFLHFQGVQPIFWGCKTFMEIHVFGGPRVANSSSRDLEKGPMTVTLSELK